ncbi:MAG: UV DNA damage repair endonuclease UvsE [Negativicutes bacterium]|nr:UV DNA damage repair endonuclease UvsE [Negativicutes bacterium]
MQIRFGYVAIALAVPEGSPNKTTSVKAAEKLAPGDRISRLSRLMNENLATSLRILRYNSAHQIHLYRFTSKLVPLATHPIAAGWDYIAAGGDLWQEIGEYIRLHGMRVSAHPDHYTLLNSPKAEVLAASIKDLDYHARIFEAMGLAPYPSLVLHVGGQYKEKETALQRFSQQFASLPERLRLRLMIENDDKIFTAAQVLRLCEQLGCPMVLDVHHHRCNNEGESLADLWPRIAATWPGGIPKIHVSSPKSAQDIRAHADTVAVEDILPFVRQAGELGRDFDIMVEAKQKDAAMFQLVEDLAAQPGIRQLEQAALEL